MPGMDGAAILATLETVAERHGDPTAAIYVELFSRYPELERLFWLDRDGSLRAAMVQQALECILDQTGEGRTAATIISAERARHDSYGVPPERFDDFLVAMREVSSTGRRNTFAKSLSWGLEVQCFPWPLVELARHLVEVRLREGR